MKYENLDVWKKSFSLSLFVYQVFNDLRDFGLKDQMCRCAVSVPSNIAEGYERYSDKERAYFLSVAKGSVGELKTQLMIAFELGYINHEQTEFALNECEVIGRMLGKLIYVIKSS
ncbi:four helix bundle protein [Pseudoalteromonas sp. SG41-2]|nr:four helix bundle protein [Pseudoalteromonas sp. SG41-2]MBB1481940.1 four helix bundle protein [Pseudoalteromonas sp. SG41-2]